MKQMKTNTLMVCETQYITGKTGLQCPVPPCRMVMKEHTGGDVMPQRKRYVQMGLTVFCTVGAILLFYDTLFGHRVLLKLWRQFLAAIAPILYGCFMA